MIRPWICILMACEPFNGFGNIIVNSDLCRDLLQPPAPEIVKVRGAKRKYVLTISQHIRSCQEYLFCACEQFSLLCLDI